MEENELKRGMLNLFKKDNLKGGGKLNPDVFTNYVSKFKKKNEIADAVDDLINKGLALEARSDGKLTLILTKSGEEFIYS